MTFLGLILCVVKGLALLLVNSAALVIVLRDAGSKLYTNIYFFLSIILYNKRPNNNKPLRNHFLMYTYIIKYMVAAVGFVLSVFMLSPLSCK